MTGKELVLRKIELEKLGHMTKLQENEYKDILKQLEIITPDALVFSPYFVNYDCNKEEK